MPLQTSIQNLREKLTNLGTAAEAVGLEDHRALLAASRKRTRESHVIMAQAAGLDLEAEAVSSSEDSAMGDLTITGDIQIAPGAPPPSSSSPTGEAASLAKDMAKLLGAGAIGAGTLVGGQWALDSQTEDTSSPPAVVQPDHDDHTATIRPMP